MPGIPVLATAFVAGAIATPVTALFPHGAGVPAKPSATVDAKQPLLSIAVDNGRTEAAAGDELTYKVKIRNLGTTEARQLQISQSLPAGLTLVSADHGGRSRPGSVSWTVNLKAGQESVRTTVATVGPTPDELLRLATVACVIAKGGEKPLVCATHSDLLPAGAAAARVEQPASHRIWYGPAAAAAAVVGLAAIVVTRRLRRRGRAASATPREAGASTVGALSTE